MKWFLLLAAASLVAFGAGCVQSSQAFEVTSPDGSVISGGDGMSGAGIIAPAFSQQPTISGMSGAGALQ
ncbi:MAG: hypothetical protein WA001_01105 [Patescibacteria group bacterium]